MVVLIKIMVTIIFVLFLVAALACIVGEIFDEYRLENFGNFMFKVTGTAVIVSIITFGIGYAILSMWF